VTRTSWFKCVLHLSIVLGIFSVTPAQPSPSPRPTTEATNASPDTKALIEYSTFLREEEKAHREYLEKLYTTTSVVLGILITVGVGLIGFLQFKTKKDVREAVETQFKTTVEKELNAEVKRFRDQLEAVTERVNIDVNKRVDELITSAGDRFQESLIAFDPSKFEGVGAGSTHGGMAAQPVSASVLTDDEEQILNLMNLSNYSFRSLSGITSEAVEGHKMTADKVKPAIENLTRRGLLGRTLGKRGGERWFITESGRNYLTPKGTA
jgi:hypothetical protein